MHLQSETNGQYETAKQELLFKPVTQERKNLAAHGIVIRWAARF